ncbi:origin recognition complex subunit [Culex quinquefasciatus]|uniref:Origin recognition complex subunit n=1 Tax=Culex quinquefasciatus TaxID=7176 RepID=B0WBE5_CULQU|nr:origin recognition complex subunit [Culex quinquefasciatus]|eukprot:XP_001846029.1 origin recognition complex subunit [Culex quinquefasciatus]
MFSRLFASRSSLAEVLKNCASMLSFSKRSERNLSARFPPGRRLHNINLSLPRSDISRFLVLPPTATPSRIPTRSRFPRERLSSTIIIVLIVINRPPEARQPTPAISPVRVQLPDARLRIVGISIEFIQSSRSTFGCCSSCFDSATGNTFSTHSSRPPKDRSLSLLLLLPLLRRSRFLCVAPGMKLHRAKGRRRDEDSPKAILNRLTGHVPCAANGYASLASVDSMKDFVVHLARLSPSRSYIVVLENAERVRDMDHNVLPMLLRLPEVTGLNVCVVLVWDLPFEKYFVRTGLAPVVKLFVAEYSKKDILVILMNDFEAVLQACQLSEEEIDKRLKIVEMLTPDFFENYLNIFLNVFFKVCRDLKELQLVALECFHKYCEPMLDGTIAADDVTRLWRNISKTLKLALGTIFMRMRNVNQEMLRPITVDGQTSSESMQTMKRLAQNLELPFYAKFLLIAAYLASHNPAKEDKRLFMKYHGKQ